MCRVTKWKELLVYFLEFLAKRQKYQPKCILHLCIKMQQKFYELPKRYNKIEHFKQFPAVFTQIPDKGTMLKSLNLIVLFG